MAKRTKRIYHGPEGQERSLWWDVKISDAKEPAVVVGDLESALQGAAGKTIGCALSNIIMKNASAFPRKPLLASFTKTTAVVIDKIANGAPSHGIRYDHSYGHITDANDKRTLKKMVQDDPGVMERAFVLRVPHKQKPRKLVHVPKKSNNPGGLPRAATFIPRGALLRAEKAGLMDSQVSAQLKRVAAASSS